MRPLHSIQGRPRTVLMLALALLLAACEFASPVRPPPATPVATVVGTGTAPTSAPTPVPTDVPAAELLERGLRYRTNGDYDAAAEDFYSFVNSHPDHPQARLAQFYLAESFALRGRWTSAVSALNEFIASGPQDELSARARFLIARGHEQAGSWAGAVAAYSEYRALGTPIEPYARLRQATQEQALGLLEEAAQSYEAVAAADLARVTRIDAYEHAAAIRNELGQPERAQAHYAALLELAQSPEYRARMLLLAAATAATNGDQPQQWAWLQKAAEIAPATPEGLDAVGQLLADPGASIDPEVAAIVYQLHEQWAAARSQYDRAIAATSGEEQLDLRRRRALTLRQGPEADYAAALEELAAIGAASPDSEAGRQAQLDWVQTLGQSGETERAVNGYREFAAAYAEDARAPEALSRAAVLLERLNDPAAAAQQRLDLAVRYPEAEQAYDALFVAGLYYYDAGQLEQASATWAQLHQGTSGIVAAQAAYWSARAAPANSDQYEAMLDAAIDAAPDSYYATRAAELLGQVPEGAVALGTPIAESDWRALEQWLAAWSGTPEYNVAEQGYPPELLEHGSLKRALGLNDVGLQSESLYEWSYAQEIWGNDPARLYLLARLAHEQNQAHVALNAAAALLRHPATSNAPPAPVALRRLLFPTPYSDLVIAQAQEYELDPRMLYSLMRQESLFNPAATSWVGARGLAQVMPETGQHIAQSLGLEHFSEADLYRPAVSIRFGAFYLDQQIMLLEGSFQGALAAYNGGPGNALRWAGGTTVADPDRFAERIDYGETRSYVKLVYGYYGAYQRLYRWP